MGFRFNSAKSSQKKKKNKKRPAPPPKKATAHKSIAQSGTIKPSRSCEGGACSLFFFHDWGKHNAGEEKKQSGKTIDSLGFLYVPPSVCEMSTKAEQCKYGGVFFCFFGCLCVRFFFFRPVLSWWGGADGGGVCKLEMGFLFFLFLKKEKNKRTL